LDKPKLIKEGAMQFKMVFAAMLMAGAVGAASAQNFGDVSLKAAQVGAKDMPSQAGVPVAKQAGTQQSLALAFAEGAKTPFQILEALYEAGQPMPLDDFPTFDRIKSWDCSTSVDATTTSDQVGDASAMYIRVPVALTPAIPPTSGAGPLFPGTPGTPAVLGSFVAMVDLDAGYLDLDYSTKYFNDHKIKEVDYPGVTKSGLVSPDGPGSNIVYIESFHKTGNLVVQKMVNYQGTQDVGYSYCWHGRK
jgi:hypothetical protein